MDGHARRKVRLASSGPSVFYEMMLVSRLPASLFFFFLLWCVVALLVDAQA